MSERENALGKIRRLLKLGTSSNEHEARLALAKAAEIALRFSIDLGSVKADEERVRIAEVTFESRAAYDHVEKAAVQICMAIFHVKAFFEANNASYFGLSHNVEAARTAHAFVIEQCGRDLAGFKAVRRKERRRQPSKSSIAYYCEGWQLGARARYQTEIEAMQPQVLLGDSQTALILRSQEAEVNAAFEEKYPMMKKEKRARARYDGDAHRRGLRAGMDFSVRSPIERGAERFALEG